MKLPIDIRDIVSSGTKLREDRERPVRIAVYVDVDAPEALVEAVREATLPQTGGAMLHVEACAPGDTLIVDPGADAVIALTGDGTALAASVAGSRERFVPTVVLGLGEGSLEPAHRLGHPLLDTIVAEDPAHVTKLLGAWLVERVSGKRLALAHNFVFLRRAVAEESIKATALQNGVIGFVMVIPGADMPLMTANQAKMILQMAAAYGQPLGAERMKELAAVVGSGFTLRAVARQVLTAVPGFGWAVKAGIGYTGTLAMGYAALEYFEDGGDMSTVARRARDVRDKVISAARERVSRGLPAEKPEATAEVARVLPRDPAAETAGALPAAEHAGDAEGAVGQ
jgi:uncharacterized protein (DUF697 family)